MEKKSDDIKKKKTSVKSTRTSSTKKKTNTTKKKTSTGVKGKSTSTKKKTTSVSKKTTKTVSKKVEPVEKVEEIKEVKEPVVVEEVIVPETNNKPEEDDGKKRRFLLILVLLLFLFALGITFLVTFIRGTYVKGATKTPTSPKIMSPSSKWVKEALVSVEEDSESVIGVDYYEYCIIKTDNLDDCEWKITTTKNVKVTNSGVYHVSFRAVDKEGEKGYPSEFVTVYVDNSNPVISNIKVMKKTTNSITIKVSAKDEQSGVYDYYYSLDGKKYTSGKNTYTFNKLEKNTEYTLFVKVVDKVGNEVSLSTVVKTDAKDDEPSKNPSKPEDNKPVEEPSNPEEPNKPSEEPSNPEEPNEPSEEPSNPEEPNKPSEEPSNPEQPNKPSEEPSNPEEPNKPSEEPSEPEEPNEPSEEPSNPEEPSEPENPGQDEPEVPEEPEEPEDPEEDEPEEVIIIPEIDLDDVPSSFTYGDTYSLPSHYDFKGETGTVSCIVEGKEYTDTSTLKVGTHLIVCEIVTSKNTKVMVEKEVTVEMTKGEDLAWDGWVRMNLFYPENATVREWRLGNENEVRTGLEQDGWQDYTGPILVKLSDVENIYIRYKIGDKVYTIAPKGKLLVDIIPSSYSIKENYTTKVRIVFDETAEVKEYRIAGGDWKTYNGEFEVGPNTVIEARASKQEKVFDSKGDYQYSKSITGSDNVFISQYLEPVSGTKPSVSGVASGGVNSVFDYQTVALPNGNYATKPVNYVSTTSLEGPVITVNPTNAVSSTNLVVTTAEEAEKIYVKIGDSAYQEYTDEIEITENGWVKAYYIRKSDGKVSKTTDYYVNNIVKPQMPYIKFSFNPSKYLSEDVDKVEVTISGNNYNTLEYSFDGEIYEKYTGVLTITESTTIYAKAVNNNGTTIEKVSVVTKNAPKIKEVYDINISLNPEQKDVQGLVNETIVSIDYDTSCDKKYFKTYYYDSYKEYTGDFTLNKNATIYAYCKSDNGSGETSKSVNYLTTGISAPKINVDPTSEMTQQVKVSIEYSNNAEITRYRIGNGDYLDYNGPFYVYENTTITAYNKDVLGNENESKKSIKNIYTEPNYVVVDKGSYYIINLNYPQSSDNNEYKWTPKGSWKPYNKNGILLIKPEYKDELVKFDGVLVKDNNDNEVLFTDDYYFLDVPISELFENLFMRWDTAKPSKPEIVLDTNEPTRKVNVSILYDSTIVEKYYKVVKPNGEDTGWLKYNGSFEIEDNNTVIYAKGTSAIEVSSDVSTYKITNIDEIEPEISVIGDFNTPKISDVITVKATDNLAIDKVAWASGEHDVDYFEDNGNVILNNSSFKVSDNGVYTIFTQDKVGNKVVKVIEIDNIDHNAPNISIEVLTPEYGIEAEVSIDFGDSNKKEYRIGENSSTYNNYSSNLIIKSNDVLNLVNPDGSLTIYARGTDIAGNVSEVSEKIYVLDLDPPAVPIINASAGYPILTEYGVKFDDVLTVTFDNRNDITNYISLDNGNTWKVYTGVEHISTGTVKAKSVKKNSGLTVESSKKVVKPSDALGINAYDGDTSTSDAFSKTVKFFVSSEMYEKKIVYKSNSGTVGGDYSRATIFTAYDKNGKSLGQVTTYSSNYTYTILDDTEYIVLSSNRSYKVTVTEVELFNQPVISNSNNYPLITEYGIKTSYKTVDISYFQTSVERLYKINDGEWENYKTSLSVEIGDTVYAKGIDKSGIETPTVSYDVTIASDNLNLNAFDGSESTTAVFNKTVRFDVSKEMWGNDLVYKSNSGTVGGDYSRATVFTAYDKNGTSLGQVTTYSSNYTYRILENTSYIVLSSLRSYQITVKEVEIFNKPVFSVTNHNPLINERMIDESYKTVSIDYFQTSKMKLYKIDDDDWINYTNGEIKLKIGSTIYAKGIDKDGKETDVVNYTATLSTDSLSISGYDGDTSTTTAFSSATRFDVSSDMWGKGVVYKSNSGSVGGNYSRATIFTAYDKNGTSLGQVTTYSSNYTYIVLENTDYIVLTSAHNYKVTINDMGISTKPIVGQINNYLKLTTDNVIPSSNIVNIKFLSYLNQKLYSVDNGNTWLEYTGEFESTSGTVIKAKGVFEDGTETEIVSYTVSAISDVFGANAFDKDKSTYFTVAKSATRTFTISEDTYGKVMRVYTTSKPATNSVIKIVDKNNNVLVSRELTQTVTVIQIPAGSYKVSISAGSSAINITEINFRERVIDSNISPNININYTDWSVDKTIDITYPEGYKNEYSLDLGETWITYESPIVVNSNTTIIARVVSEDKVISSSSLTITKIDETEPGIVVDVPDDILLGTSYKLPTSYTVDNTKSGGSAVCKIGEDIITNTNTLSVGTYEINCNVTTGAGNSKDIIKIVNVYEEVIDSGEGN